MDITKDVDEGEEAGETKKVKVIACHEMTGIDPETFAVRQATYAWCVILKESDITTEEEFADLYANKEASDALFEATGEELGEAAVAQAQEEAEEEVEDPNVCSCGANREMCQRNQNVFGGHLNG
jgi:ferric-dicitrate binding protein FerR (iron transport regulator)